MTDETNRDKNGEKRAEHPKERFFKSGFYDTSDLNAASENAYDQSIGAEELKKRRMRDWVFILIGVPAFIAFMYLIVMIFR